MKTSNIMSKYLYALFELNDCLSLFKKFHQKLLRFIETDMIILKVTEN